MKHAIAILLIVGVSGCASMASRWEKVSQGQSREEVLDIMGKPKRTAKDNAGRDVMFWQIDQFERCGVVLGYKNTVEDTRCQDNAEARAQYNAAQQQAAMMYFQMQQRQPTYTPPPAYQAPTFQAPVLKSNQQTHCTSRASLGTVYTDCY